MKNLIVIANLVIIIVTPIFLTSCMSMLRNVLDSILTYFLVIFIGAVIFALSMFFTAFVGVFTNKLSSELLVKTPTKAEIEFNKLKNEILNS